MTGQYQGMSVLTKYRHILFLTLFLFTQIGVSLHQLDFDNPDHLGDAQCQLCVHINGLDTAPFEPVPDSAQSPVLSHRVQTPLAATPETVFFPPYHSRAPPRADSFIS